MAVYIVQDIGHYNFAPAMKYGELIACIDGRVSLAGMQRAFSQLQKSLSRINENDWLIPTGHPALIAYAGHLMGLRAGKIRILSWDGQATTYIPSQIDL
jgi:hypothetical protein